MQRAMRHHAVLLGLVATLGCSSDEIDEAGAKALWQKIQAEDYRSWTPAPGWEEPQPSVGAHGDTALIYLDDVMATALEGPSLTEWPDGALLVKDIYDGNGESLTFVAAMEKQSGSWFFAEWTPSGKAKFGGRPEVCTNCHDQGADSVFSAALP